MPTDFSGTWSMNKQVNCTSLMELLTVSAGNRPAGPLDQLTVEVTQDGDQFTIKSITAKGTNEYSFEVGTTFETRLTGWMPKMKVSAAWDGDRLVLSEENGFKLVREIVAGQMVTTMSKDGTEAKIHFDKA